MKLIFEEKKVDIVKVKNSVQQHSVDANVNISIEKEELETEEGKNVPTGVVLTNQQQEPKAQKKKCCSK